MFLFDEKIFFCQSFLMSTVDKNAIRRAFLGSQNGVGNANIGTQRNLANPFARSKTEAERNEV